MDDFNMNMNNMRNRWKPRKPKIGKAAKRTAAAGGGGGGAGAGAGGTAPRVRRRWEVDKGFASDHGGFLPG